MATKPFDINSLPLSSTVRGAYGRLSHDKPIAAWDIVTAILANHAEYGHKQGREIASRPGPATGQYKALDEWFIELSELFDLDVVANRVRWLNGQLVIWGLARLDPALQAHLDSSGFLPALEDEYTEEKNIRPVELLRGTVSNKPGPTSVSLTGTDIQERLKSIDEIENGRERALAIIDLLQYVPEDSQTSFSSQILEMTLKNPDPEFRASIFVALLGYLPPEEQQTIVPRALDDISQIQYAELRASLSARILPYVQPDLRASLIDRTLKELEGLPTPSQKADAYKALEENLTDTERQQLAPSLRSILGNDQAGSPEPNPPTPPPPLYLPPVAGYISDRINDESPDLLNLEREVANIANVLTFKQVQPPLALGLFGDWGSGKSFFMGQLRKYIQQLASHYEEEEKAAKTESSWCSRVAQIDFNAWHFSDSNLWASLVTRIYEGLDRELNQGDETADEIKRKMIQAKIVEAEQRTSEAESQLEQARKLVGEAEDKLDKIRQERKEKENTLHRLIGLIPSLLKDKPEVRDQLEAAANSLGVPEAAKTYQALEDLNGELQGLSGRTKAVFSSLLYSPLALVLMAVFIVVIPGLVTLAIEKWGTQLSAVGKNVIEASAFLLSIIGWLRAQVKRGLGLVGQVESALREAQTARQNSIERDDQVKKARVDLTIAQAAEQAAGTNLDQAKTDLQRLQDELQELRPERKLQRLIESRASTRAYAQYLGIISLIRSDFELMSNILSDMASDPERDFEKAPPIQRIILYIDDLDRCKPERVVEVLEAIHLLLFFRLFVVVVAVDPRWLRHSLAQHYPATLNQNGSGAPLDDSAQVALYSTPQDYLEKIFQIPFALRPVDKSGYEGLVNDLLKPLPKQERRPARPRPTKGTPPDGAPTSTGGQAGGEPVSPGKNIQAPPPPDIQKKKVDDSFKTISSEQLKFTKWEEEDIQKLWIMFRTPRTVKRFINIYRLLRAGLVSDEEVKSFEGSPEHPGNYQVALLLLAAITAFPNQSNRLLFRLDAWLDVEERNEKRKTVNWQEILTYLRAENSTGRQVPPPKNSGAKRTPKADVRLRRQMATGGNVELDASEEFQSPDANWIFMLDCLDRVTQNSAWKNDFAVNTLRTWVLRVARFSFSVQPT